MTPSPRNDTRSRHMAHGCPPAHGVMLRTGTNPWRLYSAPVRREDDSR